MEFLLIENHSKQRGIDCILEGIKFSIYLVVDKNLGDFLKDMDDEFSSNLKLPEFEPGEEYAV
jgi:hypothetical protein